MLNSKILFLGDVYLDKSYEMPQIDCPIVFNLEAPLTQRSTPIAGKVVLKSSGKFLNNTFSPLPAAVCLANNHVMDYGNDGFLDTINYLACLIHKSDKNIFDSKTEIIFIQFDIRVIFFHQFPIKH